MSELRVCFVGIGSIAKRHIRNLHMVCAKRGIKLCVDAYRHSQKSEEIEGVSTIYYDIKDLPVTYDIVFITNPTEYHLSALQTLLGHGKHFFIEKPVVSINQIKNAEAINLRENSIFYVACPLRYSAVIQYLKTNICVDDVISVRSMSSSYLPAWRPGQDYRNTYSAHKNMGGGVSIDLIHEWDYLTYLFDEPKKIYHLIGKKSSLEIDSDDYAIYIADNGKQIIELHLDYFGRKTLREILLFMKDDTVLCDIANSRIVYHKQNEIITFNEERNDYQLKELEHFIDMVLGIAPKEDGYQHAIKVLKLTQGQIVG